MRQDQIHHFQEIVLEWYANNQRHLPWRKTHDPYAVLVSEVMLQQTQVERVLKYWTAWLERWSTFASLASAPTAEVIRAWQSLGYNRRAVNLQRAARFILEKGGFDRFRTVQELQTIPGIGPGTAGALMNFVWNIDTPFLEVNIKRILQRLAFGPETLLGWAPEKELLKIATTVLPKGQARMWPHALMDFGALACRSGDPWCERCPLHTLVEGRNKRLRNQMNLGIRILNLGKTTELKRMPFEETNRYWRGRIIDVLREADRPLREHELQARLPSSPSSIAQPRLMELVASLEIEGLLANEDGCLSLPS